MFPNRFLKNRSGIYGILNRANGKLYVGRTKCFYQRSTQYISDFRKQKANHINEYLLSSFNKYGIQFFEMFVLEFCNEQQSLKREVFWMNKLDTCNAKFGYNLRQDSKGGMIAHEKTKTKISKNLRKQWAEGVRSQHSEKLKANWCDNKARRTFQAQVMKKALTKFEYHIENEIVDYKGLVALGFQTALSSFHRTKKDTVVVKGTQITRKLV